MIVQFKGISYETSCVGGLRFHVLRSWFPIRRLLRAFKRTILSGANWLLTVLLFLPICLAIYRVMHEMGIIRWDEIVTELVSITLGSIILLFVKETLDAERRRSRILKLQYSKLREWDYRSFDLFMQLCSAVSVDCSCAYPKRCFTTSIWTGPHYGCRSTRLDKLTLLGQARTLLNTMRETAEERGFIDWDSQEIDCIYQRAIELLSRMDCDDSVTAETMRSFFQDLCDILSMVARPWGYHIDRARNMLVRKFLDNHAVKL